MDLRLLGPIEASVDGRPVTLGPPKQRAVLAMLALEAGRTVSSDRLVDGLWGDEPPASAPKMVQLYVSQLRRLMEGNGAEIVRRGRGYELQLSDGGVDVAQFMGLVERGQPREALALWRGDALADLVDEPFAASEISQLDELRLRAVELAIDADLEAGRHAEVIGELDALVAAHPFRESLHAKRMLALYRAGRQSDALAAYRDARQTLVEEIGVEPGAELQRLQRAVLEQDPSLDPPQPAGPDEPSEPKHERRRFVLVAAIAVPVALLLVFGLARLGGSGGLGRIDENSVGLIDPGSGDIARQFAVGRGPAAMAAGDGSVWVANSRDGTVAKLQPGRDQVETIDVGGEPAGLAFGAGSLWVADGSGRTVAQVDPFANKVVQRFDVGNAARAVAFGYGAVWASSAVDGTVARIDLARGRITNRIAVGTRPTAIAAGLGGIWVASDVGSGVVHIEPRSRTVVARTTTGNAPSSVAVGAGAVWVANRADGNVSRIDPVNDRVTDTVRVGREPSAVVADDRGVWVANAGDGSVVRLDPRTARVVRRVQVGSSPSALALADGKVWSAALPASATHRGGRLRVVMPAESGDEPDLPDPSTMDPLATLTHDGLVTYRRVGGSGGGALVANLARTLPEPSADGLTYTFRLRPGLRFSNGKPVTPKDVKASIERLVALTSAGDGNDYIDLRAIDADPVANTVTIHLEQPDIEIMHKLANALVVPAASPREASKRPLPGTGPYMIKRWDGQRVGLLVRNPHFRVRSADRPDGFPDEIVFQGMPANQIVAAVDRGRSDVGVFSYGTEPPVQARARFGSRFHVDGFPQTWFAFMNTHVPPFNDARVRRALNYAVDRARIGEILGAQVTNKPTCQLLPPGFLGYTPSCRFSVGSSPAGAWIGPDLAKARRLVAESGTRGMKVEFWGSRPWPRAGEYFASLLRRLGYRATVRTVGDLFEIMQARPRPQIGLWGWIADSAAPLNFLSPLVSCGGPVNASNFCDRTIDAAMKEAATAHGPDATEKWRRVEAALAAASPTIPLVNENLVRLTAKRVGNYQSHSVWGPLVDQMWVR